MDLSVEEQYGVTAEDVIKEEIPIVKKIIDDEVWLESERRHYIVDQRDCIVYKKVLKIVHDNGDKIRDEAIQRAIDKKNH